MKVGDLVSVLYETRRYYLVLEKLDNNTHGEDRYVLYGLRDGVKRTQVYSEIKVVSEA
tara:strand:- start:484 stop:657 length:174 start_codon:yes stop_codon:yes gene_type:complete